MAQHRLRWHYSAAYWITTEDGILSPQHQPSTPLSRLRAHWYAPSDCADNRATLINEIQQGISTIILPLILLMRIYILSLSMSLWGEILVTPQFSTSLCHHPSTAFVANPFGNKSVFLYSFSNRWTPHLNGASYLYPFHISIPHLPNASHSISYLGIFCWVKWWKLYQKL